MEVTTNGKPPKINRVWFRTRYGQNFPDLLVEEYKVANNWSAFANNIKPLSEYVE